MLRTVQKVSDYHKYCPGEERVKISDAICFGRRRTSYPKCRGCQFNDEEKLARQSGRPGAAVEASMDAVDMVFKANDVRGVYPDPLNADLAWRIGHSTATFLQSQLRGYQRTEAEAATIAVGRDMRKSSPELAAALIEGIRSAGSVVVDVGMIDSSQMYFAVNHLGCAGGAQTTASHNPAQYNGFKICGQKGKPVGADTGLPEIAKSTRNTIRHETGRREPLEQRDLSTEYKAFVREYLRTPRRLKIVVDASNGMAGKWFPILFDDVPNLDIIPLNFEHNGEFVHPPNPLVDANLAQLKQKVMQEGADLGVCFDGDADRCALVDEKGRTVPCDLVTGLLAAYFLKLVPGSTVVYDLRSSRAVAEEIRKAGGTPRRERVGHSFMKKALSDSHGIFGGEVSGHFYFKDNWYCDSGMLAFAHMVNVLTEEGRPTSELIAPLARYHTSGERNFENDNKAGTIQALAKQYENGQIDFLDGITVQYKDWWFNVRASNTEPLLRLNLEANTAELLNERLAELAGQLGRPVAH